MHDGLKNQMCDRRKSFQWASTKFEKLGPYSEKQTISDLTNLVSKLTNLARLSEFFGRINIEKLSDHNRNLAIQ